MGLPLSARFKHSEEEIERFTREVREQHPEHSRDEARGRALARLDALKHIQAQKKPLIPLRQNHNWRRKAELIAFGITLLLLLFFARKSFAADALIGLRDFRSQRLEGEQSGVDGIYARLNLVSFPQQLLGFFDFPLVVSAGVEHGRFFENVHRIDDRNVVLANFRLCSGLGCGRFSRLHRFSVLGKHTRTRQ
jgi:hypothetical protein